MTHYGASLKRNLNLRLLNQQTSDNNNKGFHVLCCFSEHVCQRPLISVELRSGYEYSHAKAIVIHVVAESAANTVCVTLGRTPHIIFVETRFKHEVHDRHGQRKR
jgi:hypothetical protein